MYGSAGYFEFVLSDECRGGVKKKTPSYGKMGCVCMGRFVGVLREGGPYSLPYSEG